MTKIDWDGEVIYRFTRATRHREIAEQLLASGSAYRCYATSGAAPGNREGARGRPYTPL